VRYLNIGENIRKLRKTHKLTLKGLGSKVNLSEQAIGQYERGDRTPNIDTLNKIAEALDVPLSNLLDPESANAFFQDSVDDVMKNSKRLITSKKAEQMVSDKLNLSPSDYSQIYEVEIPLRRRRQSLNTLINDIDNFSFDINELSNEEINEVYKFILEMLKLKIESVNKQR